MKYLLLFSLLLCTPAAAVHAQDFEVVEMDPAPGAVAVDLQTTVTFTFSAPVDTSARFDGEGPIAFFTIAPADSISIGVMSVNEDLTRISFDVSHRNRTDFVWILTGARSGDGALLCRPAVLSYTTRGDSGAAVVRGWAELAMLTKNMNECSGWESPVAALLDAPPDSGAAVVAAAKVDSDAQFEIAGVRPGTYWPVLLLDWDRDGVFRPLWSQGGSFESEVGFYDEDSDGKGDSIVVTDSSIHQITMGAIGGSAGPLPAALAGVARLLQNYPNPFAGSTTLIFDLEQPLEVTLSVYDVLGRQVARPGGGAFARGRHEIDWKPEGLAPGIYFLSLESADFRLTRTLTVLR